MRAKKEVRQHMLFLTISSAILGKGLSGKEQGWSGNVDDLQMHLADHFIQGLMGREGQGEFRINNGVDDGLMNFRLIIWLGQGLFHPLGIILQDIDEDVGVH